MQRATASTLWGLLWLSCFVAAQTHEDYVTTTDEGRPALGGDYITGTGTGVEGEPPLEPSCDVKCLPWEDSVCARNGDGEVCTFYSKCYMDVFNCKNGKDYVEVDRSVCLNPWTTEEDLYNTTTTTDDAS